jgi:hypothetical protein
MKYVYILVSADFTPGKALWNWKFPGRKVGVSWQESQTFLSPSSESGKTAENGQN